VTLEQVFRLPAGEPLNRKPQNKRRLIHRCNRIVNEKKSLRRALKRYPNRYRRRADTGPKQRYEI